MLPTLKQNGEPEVAKRRKHNLSGLDFQGLLDLRSQVDEALTGYRSTLEKQLAALGSSVASIGGSGSLKGTKVALALPEVSEVFGH
jgi:hypothetical protein